MLETNCETNSVFIQYDHVLNYYTIFFNKKYIKQEIGTITHGIFYDMNDLKSWVDKVVYCTFTVYDHLL